MLIATDTLFHKTTFKVFIRTHIIHIYVLIMSVDRAQHINDRCFRKKIKKFKIPIPKERFSIYFVLKH